jgi:hypothetical protein
MSGAAASILKDGKWVQPKKEKNELVKILLIEDASQNILLPETITRNENITDSISSPEIDALLKMLWNMRESQNLGLDIEDIPEYQACQSIL